MVSKAESFTGLTLIRGIMEFLKNVADDLKAVRKVEKQLFNVEKVQLHPNLPGYETPTAYGIYQEGGSRLFGVSGETFLPTQPKELFSSLTESMIALDLPLNKIEYVEMKGGAKIRFKFPLGNISFKNAQGKTDESTMYGNFQTGFDGYTKQSFYISMYRLICSNGMKAQFTEFTATFKNTKGNAGKMLMLIDELGKVQEKAHTLESLVLSLDSKKVSSKKTVNAFLKKVTGYDFTAYAEAPKRSQNIMDEIQTAVEQEFERTGHTYWGLINGITNYTNHYVNASNLEDYLFVDGGLTYTNKAMAAALEAVK